ncbi:MAG: hypothetical protein WCL06_13320 [Bacteroidota bacterium]
MKKKFAFFAIVALATNLLFAQKTVQSNAYFDHDKYSLQQDSKRRMDSIFKKLNIASITAVMIKGHTDAGTQKNRRVEITIA